MTVTKFTLSSSLRSAWSHRGCLIGVGGYGPGLWHNNMRRPCDNTLDSDYLWASDDCGMVTSMSGRLGPPSPSHVYKQNDCYYENCTYGAPSIYTPVHACYNDSK
jgi:hypothetical protein